MRMRSKLPNAVVVRVVIDITVVAVVAVIAVEDIVDVPSSQSIVP